MKCDFLFVFSDSLAPFAAMRQCKNRGDIIDKNANQTKLGSISRQNQF